MTRDVVPRDVVPRDIATGFVLECQPDGRITRILYESADLHGKLPLGNPFLTIVQSENMHKALDFFVTLRSSGVAFDWEMTVNCVARVAAMRFSGVTDQDRLLIVASEPDRQIDELFEEMQRINNEHVTLVRRMLKERSGLPPGTGPSSGAVANLEEMMRLNSEFANMQRELSKKNLALKQSNEQKSLMLGMVAHDLRNPINVICGYADMLELTHRGKLGPMELDMLKAIRTSSLFMLKLIEELVDWANTDIGKLSLELAEFDLAAMVRNNIRLNSILAQAKDITITARCSEECILAVCDRHKIEQVLNNLITNAIKFSHRGTQVSVEVTACPDLIEITVTDQGQGIPKDALGTLFEPFSRSRVRPTAGEPSTGLGLTICRSIVEGHRGRITVDSTVGVGSTFRLVLPRRGPDDGAPEPANAPT